MPPMVHLNSAQIETPKNKPSYQTKKWISKYIYAADGTFQRRSDQNIRAIKPRNEFRIYIYAADGTFKQIKTPKNIRALHSLG